MERPVLKKIAESNKYLPLTLLAITPSVLLPYLEFRDVLGIFSIFFLLFLFYSGKRIRFTLSNPGIETSYFNYYAISIILIVLTLSVPEYIAGASIFMVIAFELLSRVKKTKGASLINISVLTTFSVIYFLFYFVSTGLSYSIDFILFLSLIGGITGALIMSVDTESDKRVTLLLSTFTVFLIFNIYGFSARFDQLFFAFILSFILALSAMRAGVADESGLLSATLIGTLMIVFTDIRFFIVLLSFYIIGSFATKYRYSMKKEMGIEEPAGGTRGYANVFANSLSALFFAMNYGVYGSDLFLVSFVASVAAALGDTIASEIGKTSRKVYLITNFERVRAGESGGISLIGEISALAGCGVIVLIAVLSGILPPSLSTIPLIAGFIAVHVDSVLGATLEKYGYLTNSGVNFFATLSTMVFCYFLIL
jgi:uncharacterized protein (TIGR00297 family)